MPEAVSIEAVDGSDGVGVAELGGAEEHDIGFLEGDGSEGVGEVFVEAAQPGGDTGYEESFRVVMQVSQLRIVS